jgi:hypothetical protein
VIKNEEDIIKVLGFRINNDEDVSENVVNGYDEYKIDRYIKDLTICVITELTRLRNNKYSDHTITIETSDNGCSLLDFDIKKDKIKMLIESGYNQTKENIERMLRPNEVEIKY